MTRFINAEEKEQIKRELEATLKSIDTAIAVVADDESDAAEVFNSLATKLRRNTVEILETVEDAAPIPMPVSFLEVIKEANAEISHLMDRGLSLLTHGKTRQ